MFKFYEIGGKVRDELLGLHNKDVDYVAVSDLTEVPIEGLFKNLGFHLRQQGYEIFLETPSCYTIRAKFPKGHENEKMTADFVLARKEIGYKPGTREPIVVPGTLYDDMQRRDFTVNAMAKDPNGEIIDFFGGKEDLKDKILRTPISGDITFEDDPLRLLRAIRFCVTRDFNISQEISTIIFTFDYINRFSVVSEERIREELYKCFNYNTSKTLRLLNRYPTLTSYIFNKTNLWLKPTNERG